jgi:outer membrane protein assembly factor BamD
MYVLTYRRLFTAGCFLTLGCARWDPANYPLVQDLYRASLERLEAGDGRNAIAGFERLTLELPARDTLLPRSHYYLGRAHAEEKEWLLAAQSFSRLASLFPDDTLADDSLIEAGRAYARIWDDPELDPTYGQSAIAMFASLISAYPSSPLRVEAEREIARIEGQLAEKDYLAGEHYRRRRSPHSAILYYKQVLDRFPNSRRAPDAYAKMAQIYKSIGYDEDFKETCDAARERFASHGAVREVCGNPPPPAPATPPPATVTPPPPTTGSPPPPRAPPTAARHRSTVHP